MGEEFKDDQERTEFLLETLLNRTESLDMRDSAAVYLGNFDSEKALNSLIEFACNDRENNQLLISCGDSIAQIWDRNKDFDIDLVMNQVSGTAKEGIRKWLGSK